MATPSGFRCQAPVESGGCEVDSKRESLIAAYASRVESLADSVLGIERRPIATKERKPHAPTSEQPLVDRPRVHNRQIGMALAVDDPSRHCTDCFASAFQNLDEPRLIEQQGPGNVRLFIVSRGSIEDLVQIADRPSPELIFAGID